MKGFVSTKLQRGHGSPSGKLKVLPRLVGPSVARLDRHFAVQIAPHAAKSSTEYILSGPLIGTASGLEQTAVTDDWDVVGQRLIQQLGFDANSLTDAQRARVFQYYLPVYKWIEGQMGAKGKASGPLVIGISAPQGCGKSTLVEQLELLFQWRGIRAATVSIDDFYLTYEEQSKVAAANPSNRLLQLRGNAGSHDLALGERTLQQLKALTAGAKAPLPRYDKSAYSGRGDRADAATWPSVDGPLDVVLLEGWMLGFAATSDAAAAAVDPDLVPVNQLLRAYPAQWDKHVDAWLVIKVSDPQWVYQWRLQAEQRMREAGKAGMSDQQIADFVDRFMPAYKLYLPGLYKEGPTTAAKETTLTIQVDATRTPVRLEKA